MIRSPLRSPLNPVLSAVVNRRRGGGAAFDPAKLFASGEPGFWYDPSDFSTMFHDSAGSTPVTAVGQPVGLVLDKSQGLVLGADIFTVSYPYSGTSGWGGTATLSESGGNIVATASTWKTVIQSSPIPTTPGNWYRITVDFISNSTGVQSLRVGTYSSGADLVSTIQTLGPMSLTVYFRATTATSYLWLETGGGSGDMVVGEVTCKSVAGNHAKQATPTGRPVLQQDGNGKYYLAFDGVDDSMVTAAINFTATDKMSVFAGVRKNSGGAQMIAELSTDGTNAGSFYFACGEGTPREWSFYAGGSTGASPGHVAYDTTPAPDTAVISGTQDIAGDLGRLRRNGIYGVDSTQDKGTGNFGNSPLYIGRRGGTTLQFNGRIYSLIVRGALSDAAQIAAAEAYLAGKTGVTL